MCLAHIVAGATPPSPNQEAMQTACATALPADHRFTARDVAASPAGLRLAIHPVRELCLGQATSYRDGKLTVCAAELEALGADPALAQLRVSCASPGDSTRLVKLLDCVEPRTKGPGGGGVFPGMLGPARAQGAGVTHVLRGAAVVVAGHLPRAQEAVVQMCGPAASLSPVAGLHNVVIEFTPAARAQWPDVEVALRRAALRIAASLAQAAIDQPPAELQRLERLDLSRRGSRPRVVAITNIQTQGAFKDVFVYGRSLAGGLPTLIDPGELADGAVVSGQYGHPGLKNPTFVHQNNPVVAALAASEQLQLAGVVLSPEPVAEEDKRLVSEHAARLCLALGADGAIVTKEGGGNADADVAMKMDALQRLGIEAVGLFAEMAGRDGSAPPLVVAPADATAMVSTGNYDEPV